MLWLNMAVSPRFSWPNKQVEIPFEGYKIVLQPRRYVPENPSQLACTVSVFDPDGTTFEVGGTVASRFLSRLAWSRDGGVVELFPCGSNNPNRPGWLGQGTYSVSGYSQVEPWDYLYLPSAASNKADLALSLYREAMSLNSVPFAFLSFVKILNIEYRGSSAQKDWINQNVQYLRYPEAVDRLSELRQSVDDIGKYLYEKGRCAVAHAHDNSIVNPDNYSDKRRIENDLKLMKELAECFIGKELKVLSDSLFWKNLRDTTLTSTNELLKKIEKEDGRIIYQHT